MQACTRCRRQYQQPRVPARIAERLLGASSVAGRQAAPRRRARVSPPAVSAAPGPPRPDAASTTSCPFPSSASSGRPRPRVPSNPPSAPPFRRSNPIRRSGVAAPSGDRRGDNLISNEKSAGAGVTLRYVPRRDIAIGLGTRLAGRRRGLGPAGRRLRDAGRAGQLPRVRRPAPPPRRRRRRPAARHRLRVRPRHRAGAAPVAPACAGIDASPRLVAVARDRNPDADLRVGDMHALPWDDGTLRRRHELPRHLGDDADAARRGPPRARPRRSGRPHRVGPHQGLARRVGVRAVQAGHRGQGREPGGDGRARPPRSRRGAARRRRLRRHRAGGDPLRLGVRRPRTYARTLAATGPAYEAIQAVGEDAFIERAITVAEARVRDGLPLRAPIAVVGYLARKPRGRGRRRGVAPGSSPPPSPTTTPAPLRRGRRRARLRHERLPDVGPQRDALSRAVRAARPRAPRRLADVPRQRGILVSACASTLGDSYCSLAWGSKLAGEAGADARRRRAAGRRRRARRRRAGAGRDGPGRSPAIPTRRTAADVQALRDAGFDDRADLRHHRFVALRIAFSTVNDALGRPPRPPADRRRAPAAVRAP